MAGRVPFADWTEGMELPPLVKPPIDRVQLVRYAGASGDFNPLHTVEDFARSAGLDGVIAHGMLSMGFLGQYVRRVVGPAVHIAQLKARFQAMARPGDVLTIRGRVARLDGAEATLDVWAENQHGQVVTAGASRVRAVATG
ncbi:MAG: MaoC family dehydratase N-terminal domain-containing protein [Actinomycetia bacterium]|nr:MaoC family dehydratase N-terminal domain-containing protein [Actinomycetes bacterium]